MSKQQIVDDHGQPLNRSYNHKRINDRAIDELIGLAKGILADGTVNQLEAEFLLDWMKNNAPHSSNDIINMLYVSIKDMLEDNYLDEEEKHELFELLQSFSGEQCTADTSQTMSTTLPLDNPATQVSPKDRLFCFTGKFAYGPRKECAKVTTRAGGITQNKPTLDTDYLVIGTLCSTDWIHSSFGRKIEKAMDIRTKRNQLKIISEDTWAKYLIRRPPVRKNRLNLVGQIIDIGSTPEKEPLNLLEIQLEKITPGLLKKGWCITRRSGYVALSGYKKQGIPREERIVSIGSLSSVDSKGISTPKWEVKTHWTVKRNLFDDFAEAWNIFLEIEAQYDPGFIVWSKLNEYDEFETY